MAINSGTEYKELSESLIQRTYPGPRTFDSTPPPNSTRERLLKRSNARTGINFCHLPVSGYFGFVKDGFTTIVNTRWYIIIAIFCLAYVASWIIFGLLWWATDIIYQSGFNYTCVSNVDSFPSAFLFSVETEVTIGYGYRFISQGCHFGIILLMIQCLSGLLIDSFMLGLVFTKLTRPRNRRKTILFSELAVIRNINGERFLEFRIADVRRSQLVEAHVRVTAYWYKKDEGSGETTLEQYDLEVGYDTGRDRLMLLAPVIVRHPLNAGSPLRDITEDNLLQQDLEIVLALEGIVESTGLTVQALWSYTEREIRAGFKFRPMIYRRNGIGRSWEVNFSLLSQVVKDDQ